MTATARRSSPLAATLLILVGLWLVVQAFAGRLAARILSWRDFAPGDSPTEVALSVANPAVSIASTVSGAAADAASSLADFAGSSRLVTGKGVTLQGWAMPKWESLVAAAAHAGFNLPARVNNSYRSAEQQRALREQNCPDPVNSPAGACNPPTAKVGQSNHQRGLAVDINMPGGYADPLYTWLAVNGRAHGWHDTVSGEPWHWEPTR